MEQPPAATSSTSKSAAQQAQAGLGLFAAAFVLLIVVGGLTQRFVYGPGRHHAELLGPIGIAVTELLAIFLPALLFLRWQKQRSDGPPPLELSLTAGPAGWPSLGLGIVGGALLGVGLFYMLSVFIEPLIERFVPVPPEERAHLMRLLRPPSGLRPLWQDLLCFAAVPALCEELLFRGALLATLGARAWSARPARWTTLRAVLLSGVLFGVFHISLSKVVPTALLGIGFGMAAVLGRSLWPAIIMHFANNAMVILLIRAGLEEVPQTSGVALYSIGALACLALGWILLRVAGSSTAFHAETGNS